MTTRVSAFPEPRLGQCLGAGSFTKELRQDTGLFSSGRAAIHWACRGLATDSRILVPSYHCGVEVEAALRAGLQVSTYRVLGDLSVDEADLEAKLRVAPSIVLVIHYFGFPQPGIARIAELCGKLEGVLIEDCAHALFSRADDRPLGDFGSIAVFSLRKTLAVYDGGALRVQPQLLKGARREPFHPPPPGAFSSAPYLESLRHGLRKAAGPVVTQRYRRWRWADDGQPTGGSSEAAGRFDDDYGKGISALSRRLTSNVSPEIEVTRRRRNWERIHRELSGTDGYCPVFNQLLKGVCPLFFCLRDSNRDETMALLALAGVETFRFGAQPHPILDTSKFPESATLRDSIVGLPIHSQVGDEDLEHMLAIVKSLFQKRTVHARSSVHQ